jgi:uncharacterized protein (DUF1697 family)
MATYVALLRGINVGGKNLIKMAALKACFEAGGYRDVATYIQSGNVRRIARAGIAADPSDEEMLPRRSATRRASLRDHRQMRAIVERAPDRFGADPATYRYDVIFLKAPLTARTAMQSVLTRDGVDQAHAGTGVLYFSRLISRASQSQLSRIVSMPVYQSMTIRNWNTTTTLLRMMDGMLRESARAGPRGDEEERCDGS